MLHIFIIEIMIKINLIYHLVFSKSPKNYCLHIQFKNQFDIEANSYSSTLEESLREKEQYIF